MKIVQAARILAGLAICLLLAGRARAPAQPEPLESSLVVGRVYDIEGDILRYVPETRDWVAMVRDAPFATECTLYSGTEGRAELLIPNGTWVRIGNTTQIQFIGLESDLTEVDMASGEARFGNKSHHAVVKATSDFGYVLADPGTIFDFCVGDNSVEVIPIKGTVIFVHSAGNARYGVAPGSLSLLADSRQVSSGDGIVSPDWDRWNAAREAYWAEKGRAGRRSVQYLPPALHDESYVLDESGRWDTVVYEGRPHVFWRPTRVAVGWAPFTVGRWTYWHGDQTWIPSESFGYMTHHYGNWVYVGSAWYWAPPVVRVRVGVPLLDIGFHWNPGRVSWIHTSAYVGWVPLAPRETYYSHRRWGGRHTTVIGPNINVNVNIGAFAFIGHAIVVEQNRFYNERDYSRVRVANINRRTIINNYRAAPVVNNTVINNYTVNNNRYNYTNVAVREKPHASVLTRVERNEKAIHGGERERASVVQERVRSIPEGRISRDVRIAAPVVTEKIVPASEVSRPESEVQFKQREVRAKGGQKGRPDAPAQETKRVESPKSDRKGRPDAPAQETKRVESPKSDRKGRPDVPAQETKRVEPPKGDQQEKATPPSKSKKQEQATPAVKGKAEPKDRSKAGDKGSTKDEVTDPEAASPVGGKSLDKEGKSEKEERGKKNRNR